MSTDGCVLMSKCEATNRLAGSDSQWNIVPQNYYLLFETFTVYFQWHLETKVKY